MASIGLRERENRKKFFLYISPWLIGLVAFTVVPLILSIVYSFTNTTMATVNSEPLEFIGFNNYIYIFTKDTLFQEAIKTTFIYAIVKVVLIVVLALVFALILNRKIFGRKTFRVLIYLPAVIPVVSISLLWKLIFLGEDNVANYFLSFLGLAPVEFFADQASSLATIIFIGVWGGLGPTMLIILAAIQGVNPELLEAAELDGANGFQRIIHIVIPSISNAMVFVILTSMISALQAYAEVELLTGGANSTATMSLLIVKNAFEEIGSETLGYACAQGWVVFLITFGLSLIYVIKSSKKESK